MREDMKEIELPRTKGRREALLAQDEEKIGYVKKMKEIESENVTGGRRVMIVGGN